MIKNIIERYLNGNASKEDLNVLQQYFQTKDLSAIEEKLQEIWENEAVTNPVSAALSKEMRRNIKAMIQSRQSAQKRRRNLTVWRKVAAAAAVFMIGFGIWFLVDSTGSTITYSTGYGDWQDHLLPDGSVVKLNANSSIEYDEEWKAGADRTVQLTGEAFFEVEKKPATNAKFVVVTKDLTIEVLGTAFNVNSRDKQTDVFLEHGSIKLKFPEGEETMLEPGDFLAYSGEEKTIVKRLKEVSAEQHASWKDGVLVMKDKSGKEIFSKLEEIYGVQVQISDNKLWSTVKTISIPMDKLEVAIPILEGSFEVSIKVEGNLLYVQ